MEDLDHVQNVSSKEVSADTLLNGDSAIDQDTCQDGTSKMNGKVTPEILTAEEPIAKASAEEVSERLKGEAKKATGLDGHLEVSLAINEEIRAKLAKAKVDETRDVKDGSAYNTSKGSLGSRGMVQHASQDVCRSYR